MRDGVTVCWAPECSVVIHQALRGRPQLYCSGKCRIRAVRRNGGKAPSEPYPPLQPDAASATVAEQSGPGRSNAGALAGAGTVPQSAGVTAPDGKATAPTARKSTTKPARGRTVETPPEAAPVVASDAAGATDSDVEPVATVTQLHLAVTEDSTVPVKVTVHPMVAAYKADLERMGKADTRQGHQIVAMAEKLVSSATSPAAAANLSKELERLMAALEATTPESQASVDPSVVIRERTLAKLRAVAGGA